MSTKSPVDLRSELAELVKRKAEIAVSTHVTYKFLCMRQKTLKYRKTRLRVRLQDATPIKTLSFQLSCSILNINDEWLITYVYAAYETARL